MKKKVLKALAVIAEQCIKLSNNVTCIGWSYQPKSPDNIRKFKK